MALERYRQPSRNGIGFSSRDTSTKVEKLQLTSNDHHD
jgi:hypothetical protein